MKKLRKAVLIFISLVILSEILLRIFLDNEKRVLYKTDKNCEYRLLENQSITRFGNSYVTNSYGMRSEEPNIKQKKKILLFGDSVLNGGNKINQENIINYILDKKLEEEYESEFGVFNISAGSWGPENAYQYLINYVDFDFDLIILLFSSHDLHDNMHFRKVVGEHPAWPKDQPYLAITDLVSGYIIPKMNSIFGNQYDYLDGFDDSQINPGFSNFKNYSIDYNIPIIFYHHPRKDELELKEFNSEGIQMDSLLNTLEIDVLNGMNCESKVDYLDEIHSNSSGHERIANMLFDYIIAKDLLDIRQ